jgi:hypothetical protein
MPDERAVTGTPFGEAADAIMVKVRDQRLHRRPWSAKVRTELAKLIR